MFSRVIEEKQLSSGKIPKNSQKFLFSLGRHSLQFMRQSQGVLKRNCVIANNSFFLAVNFPGHTYCEHVWVSSTTQYLQSNLFLFSYNIYTITSCHNIVYPKLEREVISASDGWSLPVDQTAVMVSISSVFWSFVFWDQSFAVMAVFSVSISTTSPQSKILFWKHWVISQIDWLQPAFMFRVDNMLGKYLKH